MISERLEEIRQFQSLECLDLYGCRLGDNHEVFKYITSEALARYDDFIVSFIGIHQMNISDGLLGALFVLLFSLSS